MKQQFRLMTTYAYHLVLNDTEIIMLADALKMMIKACDEYFKDAEDNNVDSKAPFWAHSISAREVLKRLYDNTKLMSSNSFT